TGTAYSFGIQNHWDIFNTGDGDDTITGIADHLAINNSSSMNTGDGNDIITGNGRNSIGISNSAYIDTGDGNDTITGIGILAIFNSGIINTSNGNDSIISEGNFINRGGAINMGDGNDSIIANKGFESGSNSSGAWFLGEGDDYIKGYGSGDFYGGNGNDTLELTPGTYTVGIWGEAGESPIFTKGDQLMITSEFEKLIAGGTTYDFTSLTAGQIIVVA
ncbi:MAG: hypothetical protein ICV82_00770, partial [Nitrososphaera sp.]|nr:hypothetical protein [Nitrososphaera sp.]